MKREQLLEVGDFEEIAEAVMLFDLHGMDERLRTRWPARRFPFSIT
ncbi:hypothetical protein [Klebsiella pneumoniae]|nr:hypothetical protein [Klebsiella pneumoniae]